MSYGYSTDRSDGRAGSAKRIIVVVVTALATVVGAYLGYQGVRALLGAVGRPTFAPSDWQERHFGSIAFEAPIALNSDPRVMASLPRELRAAITRFDVYSGETTDKSFGVAVSHVQYRSGIKASVDGAVEESVRRGAADAGAAKPDYTSTPTKVSGLEARSVSCAVQTSRYTIHMRALYVVQGAQMWQLQVMYRNEESAPDADRVLDSVQITP